MPIRADQLREKEDFQKLILERLEEDNKFRIRPNTAYKPGLAMDTEVLLEFLEDTQHDEMERLRRMYKDRTNDTVINYINSEINKESRGLIDVIKHGVEFDNGVTLRPVSYTHLEGCSDIFSEGREITVLDMACGTGGMLSTAHDFIVRMNPDANVRLFGQENSPESHAICLADMLIKNQTAENICFADTMKEMCIRDRR